MKDAKFANADAQGELSASWSTGAGAGTARGGRFPGQLELTGTITHGMAERVARYLPLGIPEDTRSYVARAVHGGSVSNLGFRVRGDLWDFPFHRIRDPKEGEFRIAGRRDQFAEIDYPLLLFGRQVRLWIVGLIVVLPIVTQRRKRVRCDRPKSAVFRHGPHPKFEPSATSPRWQAERHRG